MLNYEMKNFYIFAIDPGMDNFGLSIFEISFFYDNINIINIITQTIHPNFNDERLPHSDNNFIKLNSLASQLYHLLSIYNPIAVVSEDSFFNPRTPAAFRSITKVITMCDYVVNNYNANIMFFTISPLEVKKSVRSKYKKEEVRTAISQIPELTNVLPVDYNSYDEHSIDSIAVGYSFLTLINERRQKCFSSRLQ